MQDDCNESRLRSFLDDRLPAQECGRLADHLDHCEACQRTLERLSAGSGIFAGLRDWSPGFGPPRGGSPTETFGSPERSTPRLEELLTLGFLGPASRPGSLGQLGPYDVREILGRGAFGVVLKAYDPELSRFVAIKVLAPQLAASAAARSRFAREARAAAAVVHDNVIAIHAVDSFNGLPYLVMPCITGRSLQERVERDGPMQAKEVLRVGMQAALGLAAAHEQGLVHRDIKPSNILLENGVERVKLSDFGLARAVDDASQTQSGLIAGTPQYMSPEQARGEVVDHRSDLFGLGGVLYFMCTGHPPFRADSTPAVLRRVCEDRPRPLRDVNPDIPDWLAEVVERLLAKDAEARFSTAIEVAETLKHHLADLQRTGTSKSRHVKTSAAVRRRPRSIALAAILTTTVAVLGLAAVGAPRRIIALLPLQRSAPPRVATEANAGAPAAAAVQNGGNSGVGVLVFGSGKSASKDLAIADFESVEVMHPFLVEVVRADRFGVTVTADDNVLEHIKAVKDKSALKLGLAEGKNYRLKAGSLKATIAMPALARIGLTHGARGTIRGFRSDRSFEARASHGSLLEGEIEAGDMTLSASHGSTVLLKGKGGSGHLSAVHGSKLSLSGLALRAVELEAEHGSTSRIDARMIEAVRIRASHGSRVAGTVEAGLVTVDAGHGSQVALIGRARRADLAASHGSRLALAALVLDAVTADLDHSSSATVDARESIDYQLGSSSVLKYVGNPKLGRSERSRSPIARSITAEEAERERPAVADEPTPAPPSSKDLFISTVNGGPVISGIGDRATPPIIGSGVPATKAWEIADFTSIHVGATFRAEIMRGDAYKVTTSSDDNLVAHLRVEKEGHTLKVGLEQGINFQSKEPLKATIVLPALEELEVSGASSTVLSGFRSEKSLKLRAHGASRVSGSVVAGDADLAVSGASHLTLTGSAGSARLSASGASQLRLAEFPLKGCEIQLSGASRAWLDVRSTQPFKASTSGASALDGSIEAESVTLELDGASAATLRGHAKLAALRAKSTSRLSLSKMVLQEASIDLSGNSQANVNVQERLIYKLASDSRLEYTGNPATLSGTKATTAIIRRNP
jgi:serine/threonine-protein kinase